MESKQTSQRGRLKNKPTIKRLLANKCERERVRKINEAFDVLKTHIPYCDSGRIRTKLDILKFAIDYIQILTKMVSQSDATSVLINTQLETTSLATLGARENETESRVTLNKITSASGVPKGANMFPFEDQQSLMGIISPTWSDDEVFLGHNQEKDEKIPVQYPTWLDHQPGFQQVQTKQVDPLQQALSPFDEKLQQSSLPRWFCQAQANDMLKAATPVDRSTTTFYPSDSESDEVSAWLNF